LQLGTEGYSPAALGKALRATSRDSFQQASADLAALAGLTISPSHLQRLALRFGSEWAAHRDADVQAFQDKRLRVAYQAAPQAASVMLDGGRLQTRAGGAGTGVTDPQWREFNRYFSPPSTGGRLECACGVRQAGEGAFRDRGGPSEGS
jgi:hypothetical protein